MIEGIKVKLSHEELRELCLSRVAALQGKEKLLEAKLAAYGEVARVKDLSYEDAIRNALKKTRADVARISFIADHLAPETYLLSIHDLQQLTITK